MRVATPQVRQFRATQQPTPQQPPADAQPPKDDADGRVQAIIDGTLISADYAASSLAGTASGGAAYLTTALPEAITATGSTLYNVFRSEKIGPTLKTLALGATVPFALVATAVAAPVSLIAGLWQGAGEVDRSTPGSFAIGDASSEAYTEVRDGIKDFSSGIKEEMRELGEYKLGPDEKPVDIPLIKAGKTIIMGAVGAAVGGIAGAVSAIGMTAAEAGKGIVSAFGDSDLNVGQKLFAAGTSVISAPVQGATYGLRTGLATFGNALATTWDEDSVVEGAKSIYSDATVGVAAAVAPNAVLTEVVKDEQ